MSKRFSRHSIRLAGSYLAIIMVLSIAFSAVLYQASWHELGRQEPPPSVFSTSGGPSGAGVAGESGHIIVSNDYHRFFQNRIDESRSALLTKLILLNLLVLIGGALFSYYLARRNLAPIENAMEVQNRFVTDASHELRTPLTAMLAANEVALRKPKLSLTDAKDVIRSNTEEINKLKYLSDGLLGLAKQDNQVLTLKPVSLQDVAGEAINRVVQTAQAKGITVDDQVPDVKVMGDKQSLVQAAVILLDNAIKYSPDKSAIQLEGGAEGKHGHLSVRDSGTGISPVDLPHIFNRFYRADLARTRTGSNGHGIGLSIAKKIIDQHHGRLTADSTLDEGSTFTMSLPLA